MRTNLANAFGQPKYYTVTAPIPALILVGISDSNTYIGASKLLGNVYRRVTLQPGDQVHALPGGTFAVTKAGTHVVTLGLSDKHPFEKVYVQPVEQWPLDRLAEVHAASTGAADYAAARNLPRREAGRIYERGIDSILEEGDL